MPATRVTGAALRGLGGIRQDGSPEGFDRVPSPKALPPSLLRPPSTWRRVQAGSSPCGSRGPGWRCAPARTTPLAPVGTLRLCGRGRSGGDGREPDSRKEFRAACRHTGFRKRALDGSRKGTADFLHLAHFPARPSKKAAHKAEPSGRPKRQTTPDGRRRPIRDPELG